MPHELIASLADAPKWFRRHRAPGVTMSEFCTSAGGSLVDGLARFVAAGRAMDRGKTGCHAGWRNDSAHRGPGPGHRPGRGGTAVPGGRQGPDRQGQGGPVGLSGIFTDAAMSHASGATRGPRRSAWRGQTTRVRARSGPGRMTGVGGSSCARSRVRWPIQARLTGFAQFVMRLASIHFRREYPGRGRNDCRLGT